MIGVLDIGGDHGALARGLAPAHARHDQVGVAQIRLEPDGGRGIPALVHGQLGGDRPAQHMVHLEAHLVARGIVDDSAQAQGGRL